MLRPRRSTGCRAFLGKDVCQANEKTLKNIKKENCDWTLRDLRRWPEQFLQLGLGGYNRPRISWKRGSLPLHVTTKTTHHRTFVRVGGCGWIVATCWDDEHKWDSFTIHSLGHRICYARGWGDANQIYMLLKGSPVPIGQQEHPVIHIQEHTTHDQNDHPISFRIPIHLLISLGSIAISAHG